MKQIKTSINIIFHSIHGHGYQVATAMAEGMDDVDGVEVGVYRVPETLTASVLEEMKAQRGQALLQDVPMASLEELRSPQGIVLGAPTYFGSPSAQLVAFLHGAGKEWAEGLLVGKMGSAFTTTAEQNGGAETTLQHLTDFFFHQGMIAMSLPTALTYPELHVDDKLVGGYAYGASMITGGNDDRDICPEEEAIARFQGQVMAQNTRDLHLGRIIRREQSEGKQEFF